MSDEQNQIEEDVLLPGNPRIIARDSHTISRRNIDDDALKVMRRLNGFGYQAFLVGGGVRDLLLNKKPKDFDIGTSARPEDVRDIFRNSRIIGKRFKLVHVYFKGGKIIEVATFRALQSEGGGQLLAADNTYGDPESDAIRRDLTINGLFYDAETFSIIDYVGGIDDLEKGVVRVIGDPDERFQEDPVRIIRAARHAARTAFKIHKKTADSMKRNVALLAEVPASRLYEEFGKDFYSGALHPTFKALSSFGIINEMMPKFAAFLAESTRTFRTDFEGRLERLDSLVRDNKDPLQELFFCAFIIGACREEDFQGTEDAGEDAGVLLTQLTQKKPVLSSEDEAPYPHKLTPRSVKAGRREKVSPVARAIATWFAPLVLTKREKNAAERLLVLRHRLLTSKESRSSDVEHFERILDSLHEEEHRHLQMLLYVIGDPLDELQEKLLNIKSARKRMQKARVDGVAPGERGGKKPQRRRGGRGRRRTRAEGKAE